MKSRCSVTAPARLRWLAPWLLFTAANACANDQIFCGAFDASCLPIVRTGDPLASFASNGPPVVAAPALQIFDAADPVLTGATVRIATNFHSAEDMLGFANTGSITGAYNTGSGTLSLTGSASPDDYQAALASVTYRSNAVHPQTDVRTLQWTVTNGTNSSAAAQSTATTTDCPTTFPPAPWIVANEAYGPDVSEIVPLIQNGAPGCDLGTGCALNFPFDGTIDNVLDASDSHNPGNCGAADSALTYHWELRFPPSIMGGAVATYSGVTGANTPILHIVPSGLPALGGADIKWRVILTITNANNPSLYTYALFRFQYDSSECQLNSPTGDCP
jgi:hypothetical protein